MIEIAAVLVEASLVRFLQLRCFMRPVSDECVCALPDFQRVFVGEKYSITGLGGVAEKCKGLPTGLIMGNGPIKVSSLHLFPQQPHFYKIRDVVMGPA